MKSSKVTLTVSKSAQDWQTKVQRLENIGYKTVKRTDTAVQLRRTVKGA